jgi:hypothetical protein
VKEIGGKYRHLLGRAVRQPLPAGALAILLINHQQKKERTDDRCSAEEWEQ